MLFIIFISYSTFHLMRTGVHRIRCAEKGGAGAPPPWHPKMVWRQFNIQYNEIYFLTGKLALRAPPPGNFLFCAPAQDVIDNCNLPIKEATQEIPSNFGVCMFPRHNIIPTCSLD